ncbi:hypothetical protein HK097_008257 [Rhizophlyctis rosea]|uniref:Uncharacterized protein n=1 Tax=Rhizophlyctis rosea TaxID=64517 RepID=A0AAD5X5D6_9FUNG|nr:hypothetical protein HK097_008257 [Rhizophlyctis rosea]
MLSNLISKLSLAPTSFSEEEYDDSVYSPQSERDPDTTPFTSIVEDRGDSAVLEKLQTLEQSFKSFSESSHQNTSVRDLYHQLLNPERYPTVLPAALQFFQTHAAEALRTAQEDAKSCAPSTSPSQALSLGAAMRNGYSPEALDDFMLATHTRTMEAFWTYRKEWDEKMANLGPGEPVESVNRMFPGREYARWWLAVCAPTKLVDGSWLQNQSSTETAPGLRRFAHPLFKTFAEELGEGLLEQNHVNVYETTLQSEGCVSEQIRKTAFMFLVSVCLPSIHLPPHSTYAFAHHPTLPSTSFIRGVIQLTLGQFASSTLFPESLGYNLGYEQLPLHLMVTCNEFKLLQMDYNYFQLHVTIDNAATGHAAMATQAVKDYLDWVRSEEGEEAVQRHWERILVGYYLSETNELQPLLEETREHYRRLLKAKATGGDGAGLIRNPSASSGETRFILNAAVQHIIATKAPFASKIHGPELMLGNRSVAEWLDPKGMEDRSAELVKVMERSKWIKKGRPEESPFLTGLCGFGGGMFGVFTRDERRVLEAWIAGMERSPTDEKKCPFSGAAAAVEGGGCPMAAFAAKTTAPVEQSTGEVSQSAQAMHDLIKAKERLGRTRHNNLTLPHSTLGTRKINSWFDDVPNFMMALKEAGYYVRDENGISRLEQTVQKGGCMASWFKPADRDIISKWVEDGAPLLPATTLTQPQPPSPTLPPKSRNLAPAAEDDIAPRRGSVSSSSSPAGSSTDDNEDYSDAVEIAERMLGVGVGQETPKKTGILEKKGEEKMRREVGFKVDDALLKEFVEGLSQSTLFWVLANGENRPCKLLNSLHIRSLYLSLTFCCSYSHTPPSLLHRPHHPSRPIQIPPTHYLITYPPNPLT